MFIFWDGILSSAMLISVKKPFSIFVYNQGMSFGCGRVSFHVFLFPYRERMSNQENAFYFSKKKNASSVIFPTLAATEIEKNRAHF